MLHVQDKGTVTRVEIHNLPRESELPTENSDCHNHHIARHMCKGVANRFVTTILLQQYNHQGRTRAQVIGELDSGEVSRVQSQQVTVARLTSSIDGGQSLNRERGSLYQLTKIY